MEPFIAIGELLKSKGHQVVCAFPEQFEQLALASEMQFASLGPEFIRMLESEVGKTALGGSGKGFRKFLAFVKLAFLQGPINKLLVKRQFEIIEQEKPDRIVHNGKAMYPVLWGIENEDHNIQISPVPYLHYVKGHTHVAFNSNFGSILNKATFKLAKFGLVQTLLITKKWSGIAKNISKKQINAALNYGKVIYTISPSLFPRPQMWNANMQVLGYHQKKNLSAWKPDHPLNEFLSKHENVLFLTFGSMTNPEPEKKTEIILGVLEKLKISAIINTASGGLIMPAGFYSEKILFINSIPYNWIFPKVRAVVHHGGSGTTHLAIKNACPTLIIPHIIDQFVWNKMVYEKGLGPKGMKISQLNARNFEEKVKDLMHNQTYASNVSRLASQMNLEDFENKICEAILT
jgi:UDP:flavonoid glycosyltransferase YjiC (YdhE family)